MSSRSRRSSLVEQVRGFIHRPPLQAMDQNMIELGNLDTSDVLGFSLHKEAIGGSRRSLKKVLLSAICVDYPNDKGQTPLFCACSRDREANSLLLLQYGANPNEKSQLGVTPTHVACYVGNIHLLGKLIEAGGDLRLHDNEGNSMKDWALQNADPKRRTKMLEFLEKTHICAMAYSGDAVKADPLTKFGRRANKQTSLMEIMKLRTGSDSSFENLKRVQSMGFGKVYLGGDFSGGIVSVVPLISEAALTRTQTYGFDAGFGTFVEQMEWMHMRVSVKQVKSGVNPEEGIDNIISEAEFLGKLRHPNIVLLMGVCQSVSLENMWLIFECFEEATLHHALHISNNNFPFARKQSIISQACNAMEFIHSQNLIHCGLSSMAIYLVSAHISKVGNFEFMVESMKADFGKPSRVTGVSHGQFLYNWMAPELMQEEAPHFSSDVYSFCCIIWEMFAGEVPWAGLEPEGIFQKVVEENIPLNLNYASLPTKLKAIVGYGLELHERNRLHKFSLINNWLKSEQVPEFERTHSPIRWVNRSCNHIEQTSSSSQSSLPSCSSLRDDGGSSTGQDTWAQDKLIFNKRLSLDLESPVNKVSPHSPMDLSYPGTAASLCAREGEAAPRKPPRAFANSRLTTTTSDTTSESNQLGKNKHSPLASGLCKSSAVSPSKIKPASHSYHFGSLHALGLEADGKINTLWPQTSAAKTARRCSLPRPNLSQHSYLKADEECSSEQEKCTVKALADQYQQKQIQHNLRQSILKGSLKPRGSCENLRISSESVLTESCETDSDVQPLRGGKLSQLSDIGSLSGSPLIRSSSTPKTTGHRTIESATSQARAMVKPGQGEVVHKANIGCETSATGIHLAHTHETEEGDFVGRTGANNDDQESSMKKRRAFIEDIKQRYLDLRQKPAASDETESTDKIDGSSPESMAQPQSPCQNERAVETESDVHKSEPPILQQKEEASNRPVCSKSPQMKLTTAHLETPERQTFEEEDSFWAITPLVRENDSDSNQCGSRENKCNLLHADYPNQGRRVILRADGSDMTTTYYTNLDHWVSGLTSLSSENDSRIDHRPVENIGGSYLPMTQLVSNLGTDEPVDNSNTVLDEDLMVAEDGCAGKVTIEEEETGLNGTFTVEKDEGTGDLDNKTGVIDDNEVRDWLEPLFPENTSFGSDKVMEWVDTQMDKIKDHLSQNSETSITSSNQSLQGIGTACGPLLASPPPTQLYLNTGAPLGHSQESRATVVQSRATEGQSRATEGQSRATEGQSRTSVAQSRATEGQSRATVVQSRATVGQSRVIVGQSTATEIQSRASVAAQSRATVGQSRATVGQSRATVGQSRATVAQSRVIVGQSTATEIQSKASVAAQSKATEGSKTQVKASSVQEVSDNEDFVFPEFYIDDELEKNTPQMFSCDSGAPMPHSNKIKQMDRVDAGDEDSVVPSVSALVHSSMPSSLAFPTCRQDFQHKTLHELETWAPPAFGNICQSAMSNSSELEDARRKILSRQSASDKDLSASRNSGVTLIAKSQNNPKGRDGVPVRASVKQACRCDGLRSGASDPSLSTSLRRDKMAEPGHRDQDASLQATTAPDDDMDGEEENTLAIISQDLSNENVAGEDRHTGHTGQQGLRKATDHKEVGSQAQLDTASVSSRQRAVTISDSVESDLWVKGKLAEIQGKIQRRKARPEYIASSDEDDREQPKGTAKTIYICAKTHSFSHFSQTKHSGSDIMKSSSCRYLGIPFDENYKQVMEELKSRCRARRKELDKQAPGLTRAGKCVPESSIEDMKSLHKQPMCVASNRSTSSLGRNPATCKSSSKEDQSKDVNYGLTINSDCHAKSKAKDKKNIPNQSGALAGMEKAAYRGKHAEDWRQSRSKGSGYSLQQGQSSHDHTKSPQLGRHKRIEKEASQSSILRKQSRDSLVDGRALPQAQPRARPKASPSQISKSTGRAISFEDMSRASQEEEEEEGEKKDRCIGRRGFPQAPNLDGSKCYLVSAGSTTKATESWLQRQNFERSRSNLSCEDHPHAGQQQQQQQQQQQKQTTGTYSTAPGSKSLSGATASKHSIVSFAKGGASSTHSPKSRAPSSRSSTGEGKRGSPHHRHEATGSASHSSSNVYNHRGRGSINHRDGQGSSPSAQGTSHHRGSKSGGVGPGMGDDQYLTLGLEHHGQQDKITRKKDKQRSALGLHRFYIPRESWPDGCSAKLNVRVDKDSQRVTTTATNPTSGHTETLLDQVFTAHKLKSTIKME